MSLHIVHGRVRVIEEHIVPMDLLADKLRERARQLGISNAEAARRCGLDERRFGHYVSGRREPDLATLLRIAEALGTTPNWLLGVASSDAVDSETAGLIDRFVNASNAMNRRELELLVIQAEAVSASKR
jgi:transcriptional regulator with XRE-family HTH domain